MNISNIDSKTMHNSNNQLYYLKVKVAQKEREIIDKRSTGNKYILSSTVHLESNRGNIIDIIR